MTEPRSETTGISRPQEGVIYMSLASILLLQTGYMTDLQAAAVAVGLGAMGAVLMVKEIAAVGRSVTA